jgi:hypothetical protein
MHSLPRPPVSKNLAQGPFMQNLTLLENDYQNVNILVMSSEEG